MSSRSCRRPDPHQHARRRWFLLYAARGADNDVVEVEVERVGKSASRLFADSGGSPTPGTACGDGAGRRRIVNPMSATDRRKRARDLFEQRIWGDAFAELSAVRREGQLDVEDLERLAVAAYMVGSDDACEDAWTGAHREWLRRGEAERAAWCAFRQALGLFFRGDLAPAMGWVARGGESWRTAATASSAPGC
jgi:hypothetical protein